MTNSVLISGSRIYLFGVEVPKNEIELKRKGLQGNGFLSEQLKGKTKLALIESFYFQGEIYTLTKQMIFALKAGNFFWKSDIKLDDHYLNILEKSDSSTLTPEDKEKAKKIFYEKVGKLPFDYEKIRRKFGETGRWWSIDRDDFSLRMEVTTGTMAQLLLEPTFGGIDTTMMGGKGGEPMRPVRPRGRRWNLHDDD